MFGWKIATLWLLEEPETFLHYELKIKVANYLQIRSKNLRERFQVLFTSHCDVFPQFSDSHIMVSLGESQDALRSDIRLYDKHQFIQLLGKERITTFVSLTSLYPDRKIVIVEGYYDETVLKKLLVNNNIENVEVFSVNRYLGQASWRALPRVALVH
jgi:predicted ATP-dependent endonuclease of OLD family